MYAIVEVGGKQYRVAEGERVRVEHLPLNEGQPYEINHVLLVGGDGQVEVGAPWVKGARVRATVMGHGRERKVTVFKFRRSGHYQRKRGHRQAYTQLSIERILVGGRKAEAEEAAKPSPKRAPAKRVTTRKPATKASAEASRRSKAEATKGQQKSPRTRRKSES